MSGQPKSDIAEAGTEMVANRVFLMEPLDNWI